MTAEYPAIRALTVRQPWAEPIVDGHKPTENRSAGFPKNYRGLLLIHAAKGWSIRGHRDQRIRAHYDLDAFGAMTRGAVIGIADLVDVHPAADCCAPWGEEESYTPANPEGRPPGRVTHLALERPLRIAPVEARGALGLWAPDDDLVLEVAHALAEQVEWDLAGAARVAERGDVRQLWSLLTSCESCGAPADTRLPDGSAWCLSCDLAAADAEAGEADSSTRIIGLDLSLVSTGVALPDGTTTTIHPRHVDPRGARLNDLGTQLWHTIEPHQPHAAILEGYALSGGRFPLGFARRAELVGCILRDLRRARIPVVEILPNTLKSYATRNGNADKPAMIAAAHAAGARPANDDEADAHLLRAFGLLVIDGVDLFDQPSDVPRRLLLARDLWWPTIEELAHAG